MKKLQRDTRIRDITKKPAKGRFKRWAVLAATLFVCAFPGCKTTQPAVETPSANVRCYDYQDKTLRVYTEDAVKESGREMPLSFSKLGIEGSEEPLAYFCTHSGHLFWVTDEHIFIRRISVEGGSLSVNKVLDARHIDPDEYSVSGTKIISADVWRNPDENYENITVATLSNSGLFQAARYSLIGLARNDTDRAIFDLRRKLKRSNRWPQENVGRGSLRALDSKTFVAIPLGEKGNGDVTKFYHIVLSAKEGERFMTGFVDTDAMRLERTNEGLKNIFEITSPIRYDRDLGGWVVNLMGEKADGSRVPMFPIVTPSNH